jgi:hypothetical protein
VTKSAKALPIALPKGCRGQMSEERPATRQGFFSRLFSRDDGREGRGDDYAERSCSYEESDLQR